MEMRIRLLIVEDSPDDAELILFTLGRGGSDPVWERVESAAGLRAALAAGPWDIVLSDFSMPGFGAEAALEIVRGFDPNLPFLVVSGTVGEEIAVRIMRAGANDYFLKDNLVRLLPAIQRELREAANRRAKRAAEQESLLLTALVNSSVDAILCTDLDGRVLAWNPAAERLFGYAAAEALGRADFIVPPHLIPEARARDARLGLGEFIPPFETVRLKKGGEEFPASVTLSPIRVGGRVVAKSAVYRDLTSEKLAESRVREARAAADAHAARLRAVVDTMTEGLIVADASGNLLDWNRAALHLHDFVEVSGALRPLAWFATFYELRLPDGAVLPLADWPLARVLRGETFSGLEFQLRRLDTGWECDVSYSGAPVRGPEGEIALAVLTLHDVTEQKRAERELRLFRALIDQTSDGIEVVDPATGRFLDANERSCLAHGYTRAEFLGLGVADIDPMIAGLSWSALIEQGRFLRPQIFESTHRRKDGSTFPVEVSHSSIFLDREYLVAVVRDITERKRAEEELKSSQEQFRAFMDNSPTTAAIKDEEGRFLYVNATWLRQYDPEPTDWLGKTNYDLWPREAADRFREADELSLARNAAVNAEFTVVSRGGREATFLSMKFPLGEGSRRRLGVISWDITERKRAERAVRASEERFRAFMDNSPAAADIKDEEGRLLYVNAAWLRQFDPEPTEWFGKTNYDFWPRETADVFRASDELCLGRNVAYQAEESGWTAAGAAQSWTVMKFPLVEDGRRRIGGMAWDITDRRRAEDALRLRDRAIQAATQGLAITDPTRPDNPILYVSPGFERITGYPPRGSHRPQLPLPPGPGHRPELDRPAARSRAGRGILHPRAGQLPQGQIEVLE